MTLNEKIEVEAILKQMDSEELGYYRGLINQLLEKRSQEIMKETIN